MTKVKSLSVVLAVLAAPWGVATVGLAGRASWFRQDRKSTRLNSSHGYISYAGFCLKKKKPKNRKSRSHAESLRRDPVARADVPKLRAHLPARKGPRPNGMRDPSGHSEPP